MTKEKNVNADELMDVPSFEDQFCDLVLEVQKIRISINMSQAELAQKANVDVQEIVYLENFSFKPSSWEIFWKVLFALNIKLEISK